MEEKELIKLIDKYLDEALTIEETEEFNDLLENSREFRDLFRSRVKLHADLASHYDSVEVPVIPFTQKKKKSAATLTMVLSLAAALAIALVFPRQKQSSQAPVLATLSLNKSTQLKSQGTLVVNDSLTHGTYSFDQGIIELAMPHDVTVAVEGPAIFSLVNSRKMSLHSGRVSAHVGEAGKGFVVDTPDGKIIDLGTRFGVSVKEGGKTEAHVFQGKINVVSKTKTTELNLDEAIEIDDGHEVQRIDADQARFPLPGFPLDVELTDGNFEKGSELLVGWPKMPGAWGGDHCEILAADNGINPFAGKKMLKFVKPYAKGATDNGQGVSQLWQVIDLQAFEDEVKRGGVSARLSASFNSVESAHPSSYNISILAFTGKPREVKEYWDAKDNPLSELLSKSNIGLRADENPATWEKLETQLRVPAGSKFLLVQISAAGNTLKGNYADSIKLDVATEARQSVPMATWLGKGGSWHEPQNWQDNKLPDTQRETIRIMTDGEVVIDREVNLKQPLVLALHRKTQARLRIAKSGLLNQSSNGQFLVGYNEGAIAKVIVEGNLKTRAKVFIGRNNADSAVIIDGGLWDAQFIRMSQYGSREESTQSLLEIRNGGVLKAKSLDMTYDDSVLELVDGRVEVEYFKIAGDDGSAIVNHHSGLMKVDKLRFGQVSGLYYFAGRDAKLALRGSWTIKKLLQMQNSNWHFQGQPLTEDQLKVEQTKYEGLVYSVFSIR